jgi:hypothetical protein
MSNTGIIPLTPQQIAEQEEQAASEGFIKRDLVAIDQAAETVIFGGPPDTTISSETAVMATEDTGFKKEVGELVSKGLDLFQKDHGAKAEAGDLERAEAAAADMQKAESAQ